jgi:hypothetical protein
MNAPAPITFVTQDGAERKFSLTNKRLALVQRQTNTDNLDFLWVTCDDREGIAREDFIDLFPMADPDVLIGLVKAITEEWSGRNKSHPANEKYRPTKAETQPSAGSGLLPFGE